MQISAHGVAAVAVALLAACKHEAVHPEDLPDVVAPPAGLDDPRVHHVQSALADCASALEIVTNKWGAPARVEDGIRIWQAIGSRWTASLDASAHGCTLAWWNDATFEHQLAIPGTLAAVQPGRRRAPVTGPRRVIFVDGAAAGHHRCEATDQLRPGDGTRDVHEDAPPVRSSDGTRTRVGAVFSRPVFGATFTDLRTAYGEKRTRRAGTSGVPASRSA